MHPGLGITRIRYNGYNLSPTVGHPLEISAAKIANKKRNDAIFLHFIVLCSCFAPIRKSGARTGRLSAALFGRLLVLPNYAGFACGGRSPYADFQLPGCCAARTSGRAGAPHRGRAQAASSFVAGTQPPVRGEVRCFRTSAGGCSGRYRTCGCGLPLRTAAVHARSKHVPTAGSLIGTRSRITPCLSFFFFAPPSPDPSSSMLALLCRRLDGTVRKMRIRNLSLSD